MYQGPISEGYWDEHCLWQCPAQELSQEGHTFIRIMYYNWGVSWETVADLLRETGDTRQSMYSLYIS